MTQSRELAFVERTPLLNSSAASALDVSIFEEPQKPAVMMERSLDLFRMVWVLLFLDEDDVIVGRHELDYYELARKGR